MQGFQPLAGVTVLDFSHVIAGPLASFYLKQLGARVIKVEGREGDVMRRGGARGEQAYAALNHGKQEVTLDLADPAGREEARALVGQVQILLDNLRPGVLDRFGLGFAEAVKINPKLVYCSVSGFGRAGRWASRPAYDHVIQAVSGMTMLAGKAGDPPIKTGFPVVDAGAGMLAALAMLAGLRQAEQTGRGMMLDVSMVGAAMQLLYPFACDALTTGATPPRVGNQGYSGSPGADMFPTRDGWIAIGANKPKHIVALLKALNLEALLQDRGIFPEGLSVSGPAAFARAADPAKLREKMAEAIALRGGEELEAALVALNVPVSRVLDLGQFATEFRSDPPFPPTRLGEGENAVTSVGLGFKVTPA